MALLTDSLSRFSVPNLALDAEASQRLRSFCRDLWRSTGHLTSLQDFYATVVGHAVRNLGGIAAGVWLWQADQNLWKLVATSGPFSSAELDRVAVSIRNPVALADPLRLVSAATTRLQHLTESAAAKRGTELVLETTTISSFLSQPAMLAIWSEDSAPGRLRGMLRQAAEDIGDAAGAIARQSKTADMAQLADGAIHYSPCAVVGLDPQQRCTRWNAAAMQIFGWPERDVLGQPLAISRADDNTFQEAWSRCVDRRLPIRSAWSAQRWDGTTCPVEATFVPLRGENEAVREVLLLIRDDSASAALTRALQLEIDLARELERLDSIEADAGRLLTLLGERLDCIAASLWTCDPDVGWRSIGVWNTAGPGLIPRPRYRTSNEEQDCDERLRRLAAERNEVLCFGGADDPVSLQSVPSRELLVKAAVPLVADGKVLGAILLRGLSPGRDPQRLAEILLCAGRQIARRLAHERSIALLAERESALRQSRKVEAIGMLASGIVHDFNNLLTVVLGNCELARFTSDGDTRVARFIDEIQMAGERATDLSRQLLGFCRRRDVTPQVLPLGEALQAFRTMLQRIVGQAIAVDVQNEDSTLAVLIDPIEIEQVLLNMASNARDAMPSGGRLTFTTRPVVLELRDVATFPKARPGDFVELTITDTGCGMDEATRRRLFEPFFTTKAEGRGTGLGLSTVWEIVERAGGTIGVESELGIGTTFRIRFPKVAGGIIPRQIDAAPAESPRGTESILLVEDEDALRNLAAEILTVHGYTVHAFACGAEAIQFARRSQKGSIDLLVTDLMMPGQSGDALAGELRRLIPGLSVLLMSGNHELLEKVDHQFSDTVATLRKPFASDALARAVRGAFEAVGTR